MQQSKSSGAIEMQKHMAREALWTWAVTRNAWGKGGQNMMKTESRSDI